MEFKKLYKNYYYSYQRHGNNKNGRNIYLINIFAKDGTFENINYALHVNKGIKVDKNYNIRLSCYKQEIEERVKDILK